MFLAAGLCFCAWTDLRWGRVPNEALILLALADHRGSRCDPPRPDPEHFLRQRLEVYRATMARPMVTGSDLISAGLTPDRDFSQLLAYARKLSKTHQKEG